MQHGRLIDLEKSQGFEIGNPHRVRITVEEHTVLLTLSARRDNLALEKSEDHAEFNEELGDIPQLAGNGVLRQEHGERDGAGKNRGPCKQASNSRDYTHRPALEVLPVKHCIHEIKLREKDVSADPRLAINHEAGDQDDSGCRKGDSGNLHAPVAQPQPPDHHDDAAFRDQGKPDQ